MNSPDAAELSTAVNRMTDDDQPRDPAPVAVTITLPPAVRAEYRGTSSYDDDDGMWPAEWCGADGCDEPFEDGDHVRKVGRRWIHDQCAHTAITSAADVDQAWLLLADQIAARPHRFRASEIRVVLRSIMTIAERGLAASALHGEQEES